MTGTLSDRDRELLDLSYRHGLDVDELAMVLGVSSGEANTMVRRLRRTVGHCPGPLLVALAVGGGRMASAPGFLPAPDWLRSRTLNAVWKKVCDGSASDAPTHEGSPSGVAPHTKVVSMNSQAHDVLSGRDPELSSTTGTLWALAWSDEPESLAEPVPYIGGDDAAPQSGESRFRLPTLLFGIAAGAAIAVGGLALTLGGSETQPAPAVTTEAVQSVMTPSTPATVGSPATQSVPRVANVPQRVKNSSNPAVAAAPASAPPATIAQNAGTRPAPAAPAPTAPATAPVTIMVAPPPPAAPPVITPPVVSIPDLSPLPLIHPVGPSGFGIPSVPVAPNPVVSPVLKEPIVTAAPDPVITLPTDVTLTPFAPALP